MYIKRYFNSQRQCHDNYPCCAIPKISPKYGMMLDKVECVCITYSGSRALPHPYTPLFGPLIAVSDMNFGTKF